VGASERAGLANTDPRRPELTEAEIHAAVVEAAKKGLFVAAHAHAREGCANAVRAGVRSIEHGTWVDDETLAEMKRRGTFFVPTLAAMSPLADPKGNSADDVALRLRTQAMMGPLRAAVRKAHAMGITIAASTDGSYADDDIGGLRVAHDIALLREFGGLTPLESITAATLNGARVIGIESRTGTVRGFGQTSSPTRRSGRCPRALRAAPRRERRQDPGRGSGSARSAAAADRVPRKGREPIAIG
jgi:imidazolonepropionase-like amidohydrolase